MANFNDCSTMVDMNDPSEPRRHTPVAGNDALQIVLNCYQPGQRDEFHYHKGSTRTYLILEGTMTIRIRNEDRITDNIVPARSCAPRLQIEDRRGIARFCSSVINDNYFCRSVLPQQQMLPLAS